MIRLLLRARVSLAFAFCVTAGICVLMGWLRWEHDSRLHDQRAVDLFNRLGEVTGTSTILVIEDEGILTNTLLHVGYVQEISVGPDRFDACVSEEQIAALSRLRRLRRLTLFAVAPPSSLASSGDVPQHLQRLEIESVDVETVTAWVEVVSDAQKARFELVIRGVSHQDRALLNERLLSKVSKLTFEDL